MFPCGLTFSYLCPKWQHLSKCHHILSLVLFIVPSWKHILSNRLISHISTFTLILTLNSRFVYSTACYKFKFERSYVLKSTIPEVNTFSFLTQISLWPKGSILSEIIPLPTNSSSSWNNHHLLFLIFCSVPLMSPPLNLHYQHFGSDVHQSQTSVTSITIKTFICSISSLTK